MDGINLLKGVVIGFSIAAPVGPIGILCIRRTLSSGRLVGLVSGLGAATADMLYGSLAAFGLTFISDFLVHQQTWLRFLGGVFLGILGIKTFLSHPPLSPVQSTRMGVLSAYASTFFLTLTNPLTILAFAAIFAGIGLINQSGSYFNAALTVLGVFIGSASWWVILSGAASMLRGRLTDSAFLWINRLSGLVILGFGLAAIIGVVK